MRGIPEKTAPSKRLMRYEVNYLGLAPFYIALVAFIFAPMIYGIAMSFTNWSMASGKTGVSFVGLKNYQFILSGESLTSMRFLKSLKNLALYIPFTIVVGLSISMMLALIVSNLHGRLYKFFRGLYFVPTVLPLYLCASIWKWFMAADTGLIANFLADLGLGKGVVWVSTPGYAIALVVLIDIWNAIGFNFIIFSTGIQDVPQELYEAAEIDGASTFQKMRHITLPLIEPITFFVITYSFISALQIYDIPYMLSYGGHLDNIGGPNQVILFPVMEMVRNVYSGAKSGLGRATAEGVVLMMIIMAITAVQFLLRKKRYEGKCDCESNCQ